MAFVQFLPARLKVALRTARNDVRHLANAVSGPRFKGARVRTSTVEPKLEVRFVPPRQTQPKVDLQAEERHTIVFSDSGVTVEIGSDETILEAGLRNGVDLLFSCTLGGCGACMLQVSEGEVAYDDPEVICLTKDEIEEGCCLACVGKPRGRVVVEA